MNNWNPIIHYNLVTNMPHFYHSADALKDCQDGLMYYMMVEINGQGAIATHDSQSAISEKIYTDLEYIGEGK
jgi:hypothetical protein